MPEPRQSTVAHELTVERTNPPNYVWVGNLTPEWIPRCSCGWEASPSKHKWLAEYDHEMHVRNPDDD